MSKAFKIEDNVPLAPHGNNHSKYPFREMTVGQSFFVPTEAASYSTVAQAACSAGSLKGDGTRFTIRKVDGGVRVWRLR